VRCERKSQSLFNWGGMTEDIVERVKTAIGVREESYKELIGKELTGWKRGGV